MRQFLRIVTICLALFVAAFAVWPEQISGAVEFAPTVSKIGTLVIAVLTARSLALSAFPILRNGISAEQLLQVRNAVGRSYDQISERQGLGVDISKLVIHVWIVPYSYRKLLPYRLRRWLRDYNENHHDGTLLATRPQLRCVFRTGTIVRSATSVVLKKGRGIVGICLEHLHPGELIEIDYRTHCEVRDHDFTREEWARVDAAITTGLQVGAAKALAVRYDQCVATVIPAVESGERIGVVTFDLLAGAEKSVYEVLQLDPTIYSGLAEELGNLLK